MYIFSTQNIELLFCDIPKEDGKKKNYSDPIFSYANWFLAG